MALTPLHLQDVCYGQAGQKNPYGWYGSDNACKYLTNEFVGNKLVSLCMKQAQGVIEKKLMDGQLPPNWGKMKDNCKGYRYLKYVQQGYDVDGTK